MHSALQCSAGICVLLRQGGGTCRRMKGLVTTKKLRDIQQAQQAEIANMRRELDRLHMRTFPSFVDISNPLQPDEITLW
jgi:hypothetical protein